MMILKHRTILKKKIDFFYTAVQWIKIISFWKDNHTKINIEKKDMLFVLTLFLNSLHILTSTWEFNLCVNLVALFAVQRGSEVDTLVWRWILSFHTYIIKKRKHIGVYKLYNNWNLFVQSKYGWYQLYYIIFYWDYNLAYIKALISF